MFKSIFAALFQEGFKSLQEWLEKRHNRKLERKNVELTLTNVTLRKAVQRAQEKRKVEHAIRKLNNSELSDRMRDTTRRVRKSRK